MAKSMVSGSWMPSIVGATIGVIAGAAAGIYLSDNKTRQNVDRFINQVHRKGGNQLRGYSQAVAHQVEQGKTKLKMNKKTRSNRSKK